MLTGYESKMDKAINALVDEFSSVRAGRANPAVLNKVTIDYYDVATNISQVANISVPDGRTLLIQPWDISTLAEIEKSIMKSDLGITPNNDGKSIRLSFPALTQERRQEIIRSLQKTAEQARVSIRNIRREVMDHLKSQKKKSEITEDDFASFEKSVQNITDKKIKEVDTLLSKKEKEVSEV